MRILTPYLTNRRPLVTDIFDEMERMFEGFANSADVIAPSERRFVPTFDVTEEDNHFLLSVDLPGIKKADIKIETKENNLTISGSRKRGSSSESFTKSFALPMTVDVEKIEANHEDGVLSLYLPKTQIAKTRTIEIQSNSGGFFNKLLGSKKVGEDATVDAAH